MLKSTFISTLLFVTALVSAILGGIDPWLANAVTMWVLLLGNQFEPCKHGEHSPKPDESPAP